MINRDDAPIGTYAEETNLPCEGCCFDSAVECLNYSREIQCVGNMREDGFDVIFKQIE